MNALSAMRTIAARNSITVPSIDVSAASNASFYSFLFPVTAAGYGEATIQVSKRSFNAVFA